jgi:hypothetical protein
MSRYLKGQNDKTGWKRGLGAYSGGPIEYSTDPVFDQLLTGKRPKADVSPRRGFDSPKDKATKWSAGK